MGDDDATVIVVSERFAGAMESLILLADTMQQAAALLFLEDEEGEEETSRTSSSSPSSSLFMSVVPLGIVVEGFTPKTPHSLQMDEEEKGHHHPGTLETRDRVFRFVEKSNRVAATASPHALDCFSFSNTATECASVEPLRLATIQAQYICFWNPV